MIRRTPTRAEHRSARGPRGFTLLEVLVSIVILSLGVLGVVGLQAASLQANREARSQAAGVRLGRELAELMRGNKGIAIQGTQATNPYLLPLTSLPTGTTITDGPENCYSSNCSSALNVAKFQIAEWQKRVMAELPGARVRICFDSTPYEATGTYAGRPQWDCTDTGGVAVLKLGWTRRALDSSATAASAVDAATVPSVVVPLIAGSTE